ncbi:MAG: hypothetical protein IJ167_06380 [Lachnospiraceae bacterium]|nr:hypothetical protein [Lachnospiraceae bacterium]
MSNKIIDLTEYKDNQEDIETMVEDIPEDILNDYLKQVENDTPDLWSRIDEGFDREINLIDRENKARRRKTVGFIAAAALIVVIAIPIAILNVTNHKKSKDSKTTEKDSGDYVQMEDNYIEEVAESDDGDYDSYDMYDTEASDEETSDAEFYNGDALKDDTAADYPTSGEAFDSDQNSIITDNQEAEDSKMEEDVSDSEIAKEVVYKEIAYVNNGRVKEENIPPEYNISEQIQNDFCNYPEDELTVIRTENDESIDYIYIRYGNTYVRYQRKDMNSISK